VKYSADMPDKIRKAMAVYGFKIMVCQKLGISFDTLNQWEKGNIPQSFLDGYPQEQWVKLKTEISEAIQKGEEEFLSRVETKCFNDILQDSSWQSKAWILERRLPDSYTKREKIDLNNKHSGKVNYDFRGLTLDELRQIAKYSKEETAD